MRGLKLAIVVHEERYPERQLVMSKKGTLVEVEAVLESVTYPEVLQMKSARLADSATLAELH